MGLDGEIRTSRSHPIRVDFISGEDLQLPGRLGLTLCPGLRDPDLDGLSWARDLRADLKRLREEYGTRMLVSLMEDHEYRRFGVAELLERDSIEDVEIERFPIRDVDVPEEAEEFERLTSRMIRRLRRGENVVVHCRAGLGRSGTVAACVLVALDEHSAQEAVAAVRRVRKRALQTPGQVEFVRRFERRRPRR
jgi:protein-tyrosine phosphatase